jgi:hypothetical protein
MKKWTMPAWMKPYEHLIYNTGGNAVEELVGGSTLVSINAPLALIECSVESQVRLLERLLQADLLKSIHE